MTFDLSETAPRPEALPDLHGMLPQTLAAYLRDQGVAVRDEETRRLMAWTLSHGRHDLEAMGKPVPRRVQQAVRSLTTQRRPKIVERVPDATDGSVRYLFEARDGVFFEAVRIPLHKAGRYSVCLSSQAGCAMKCVFCATGRLGLGRHLHPDEMVGSLLAVRDEVREAGGRVTGAVFMGQGEPFHNYEAVILAADILAHPCGGRIAQKAISISTVGLVPKIRRFTQEGHKYRLIVSLSSAVADKRARLMPVASRWSLDELADALRERAASTGERVTLAWVLMGGVNHGQDEVEALQARFGGLPLRLNLIDINDARPEGFRRATDAERGAFVDALQVLGVPIVRRYSVGQAQNSACGMLAAQRAS